MVRAVCLLVLVAVFCTASGYSNLRVRSWQRPVICPNRVVQCPVGSTCCPNGTDGGYGCCHKLNAVCCGDGIHCCEQGTTCDLSTFACMPSVPATVSPEVAKIVLGTVIQRPKKLMITCPDGGQCEPGNTCCGVSDGWMCCPRPNAVCCGAQGQCCPHGFTCDGGFCVISTKRLVTVVPANVVDEGRYDHDPYEQGQYASRNAMCPGSRSECPDGDTCCRRSNGDYGCCPLPNARCCSDGQHCCPSGYNCGNGKCESRSRTAISALSLEYALRKQR